MYFQVVIIALILLGILCWIFFQKTTCSSQSECKTCPSQPECPPDKECPGCDSCPILTKLTEPVILDNASITNLHSTSISGTTLDISGTTPTSITTTGGITANNASIPNITTDNLQISGLSFQDAVSNILSSDQIQLLLKNKILDTLRTEEKIEVNQLQVLGSNPNSIQSNGGISTVQTMLEYQYSASTQYAFPDKTEISFPFPTKVYSIGTGITVSGTNNTFFQNTSGSEQTWLVSYNVQLNTPAICQGFGYIKNTNTGYMFANSTSSTQITQVGLTGTAIIRVSNNDILTLKIFTVSPTGSSTTGGNIMNTSKIQIRVL